MNKDGGIVDHYCLNFLFIKDSYEKKNTKLDFIISKKKKSIWKTFHELQNVMFTILDPLSKAKLLNKV